ncbi:high affinity glucose transporter [Sporothrix bragantina]|uniref:High affinity glucose transporter n=1 Tax=Sporothrix bragantina TaxID=671064 RepID=A0ABP0CU57_9PEZI
MSAIEMPKLSAVAHVETMASQTSQVDGEKIDAVAVAKKGDSEPEVLESAFAHLPFFKLVKLFWRVNLIALLALSGALFDGYAQNLPGSIAANSSFIATFGTVKNASTGAKALNAQYVSAWGGITSASQVFSMVVGAFLSDKYGRKFNLYSVTFFMAIALVLELTAKNWVYFLMARCFAGWATGIAKTTLPCYVAEIAPTGLRSALLTMFSFWYAMGQLAVAIALQIVQKNHLSWRNAFFSELAFFGIFVPVSILLPESPWYYAKKKQHDRAKAALQKLNGAVPGYDVDHEYAVIAEEVERTDALQQKQAAVAWVEVFKGANARRTFISFLPLATQQLVGAALVFSYLSYLFGLAGVSNPFLVTVASSCILIGFLIIASLTIDKIGRRPLLLTTLSLIFLCNLFMGVVGTLAQRNGNLFTESQSSAAVALSCIWVAAYAMGPAPMGYAFLADTATPVLRAKTTGIASAFTGLFALIFNYSTPLMISTQGAGWGIRVGYFYAPLSLITLVLTYFTIPETTGRSFQELDELFEARTSAKKFKSTLTSVQIAERQAAGLM